MTDCVKEQVLKMAIIRINTDEVSRTKNNIDRKISDVRTERLNFQRTVISMSRWHGVDNTAYVRKARDAERSLMALESKCHTENQKLQNAVNNFSFAQNTIKNLINRLW